MYVSDYKIGKEQENEITEETMQPSMLYWHGVGNFNLVFD